MAGTEEERVRAGASGALVRSGGVCLGSSVVRDVGVPSARPPNYGCARPSVFPHSALSKHTHAPYNQKVSSQRCIMDDTQDPFILGQLTRILLRRPRGTARTAPCHVRAALCPSRAQGHCAARSPCQTLSLTRCCGIPGRPSKEFDRQLRPSSPGARLRPPSGKPAVAVH